MAHSDDDFAARLAEIRERMAAVAQGAGRAPEAATLVAVSKSFDGERIRPALAAGLRVFGENRVAEAAGKWPELRAESSDIKLHLVGPLQSRQTAEAVALFDVIQTLDREKIARRLARDMAAQGRHLPCFIQVNTGEESQKAGIAPAELPDFLGFCREECGLDIRGLMCLPPRADEPALHFALLAELAADQGLGALSMGMSGDFETAIAFGATHIRLGTALFGPR